MMGRLTKNRTLWPQKIDQTEYLLRVNRIILTVCRPLRVYPNEHTSSDSVGILKGAMIRRLAYGRLRSDRVVLRTPLTPVSITESADQVAWKMRAAGHYMGDGLAVILVARAVTIKKHIQPGNPLGHRIHSLQANRNAVIGEGELNIGKIGLATKIAISAPHPFKYGEAAPPLRDSPILFREKMGQPQHYAEAKILGDRKARGGRVDQRFHIGNLAGKGLL